MSELLLATGKLLTDERKILEELTKFFKTLYKPEEGFETEQIDALKDMKSYLTVIVSEE